MTEKKGDRPSRPCPFCGKFKVRLTRHLQRVHKHEDEVIAAMKLPKQDRDQTFCMLKRKGYCDYNLQKLKEDIVDTESLIKERKSRKERKDGEEEKRVMCSICKGFFLRENLSKHKRNCYEAERTTAVPVGVKIDLLHDAKKYHKDFPTVILNGFLDDESGKFCRSDEYIKFYGNYHFRRMVSRKDKSQQQRTSIMRSMRQLANLFLMFKGEAEKENVTVESFLDLFDTDNFQYLMDSINLLTAKEDGGLKAGAKKNLGHLLNNVIENLRGKLIWEKKFNEIPKLDNFVALFKFFKWEIFDDAEYNCIKNRQEELRRPKKLPEEDDVQKIRDYILERMQNMADTFQFLDSSQYIQLRDMVVCRLTLFNARRGGEPSRLTLKEWSDADKGVWLDKKQLGYKADPLEQKLLGKYKLAYQSGKCISQMVPNLIPENTWNAINKLVDPQIRLAAGVHPENNYVFPNVQRSLFHTSGWKCVESVCKQAGVSKRINATQMRHRVSTIYAALHMSDIDRQAFYRHMGHSEEINRNVYQCPLGTQEITRVGKFLDELDSGKYDYVLHFFPPNIMHLKSNSVRRKVMITREKKTNYYTAQSNSVVFPPFSWGKDLLISF